MNSKVTYGVLLLGLGIFMIVTSHNHNVGFITSGFGLLRIFQGMRG